MVSSNPKGELPDNKLIREPNGPMLQPIWIYLAIIASVAVIFWGGGSYFYQRHELVQGANPFLQVTNRQFSLFLWQFPEYMRAAVSGKQGYLPGFDYQNRVGITAGKAEDYVSAPPEVLFLYHTWKRLISNEFAERPVITEEFRDFLENFPEWLPKNWPDAPASYKTLVDSLSTNSTKTLPLQSIPKEVQYAYIGWKNMKLEGNLINTVQPTYAQMAQFIKKYPHYARNYWRNLVLKGKPDYLKTLTSGNFDEKAVIPEKELTAFLKVAFFNAQQAAKNL